MKQIHIPMSPLRVSKAWQGRKFKTKEYLKWQTDFLRVVDVGEKMMGKVSMRADFFIKNDKMSDIDNFFKTLQDTLVLAGAIEDDRNIYELHAYKHKSDIEFIRITLEKI